MAKLKEYTVTVKLVIKAETDADAFCYALGVMDTAVDAVIKREPYLDSVWKSFRVKPEVKCLA